MFTVICDSPGNPCPRTHFLFPQLAKHGVVTYMSRVEAFAIKQLLKIYNQEAEAAAMSFVKGTIKRSSTIFAIKKLDRGRQRFV